MKRSRRGIIFKLIIAAILVFSLLFMAACSETVATINEIPVTQEEVDEYVNFVLSQDPEGGTYLTEEEIQELEINIVDSLLVTKILEQYAKDNNISVSKEEVDLQLSSIIAQYESESAFETDLKEKGIDKKFLEREIKNQLLRSKIYSEATIEVIVTDEQIRQYYDENLEAQFTTPERIRVSHILSIFPWVEDDSIEETEKAKQDAKDKLEFVQEQLENGAEFGDMAREYSDDTATSVDGGDLGFITRGQMVEEFEDAAFSLDVDEVSGIIETQYGYHLIKLFDREEAGVQEFEEIKEDISAYLSELKKVQKWEEFIMGLIDDASIVYLSGDEGTLNNLSQDEQIENSEDATPGEEDQLLNDENLEDFIDENK